MPKDLDRMSFRELQLLELKLKKAKAKAQDRTRAQIRSKAVALIVSAGFDVIDIFGGRGRTVPAKYANPANPTETWTGRGRRPRWLAAQLKAGGRIDKFLIK